MCVCELKKEVWEGVSKQACKGANTVYFSERVCVCVSA